MTNNENMCIFIKVVQKYFLCHNHVAQACLQLSKKVVRVLVGMVRYELNNYRYIKQILHQTSRVSKIRLVALKLI